jgi:prepilin-type N-terminal cleavage/methylation domain-containing protein
MYWVQTAMSYRTVINRMKSERCAFTLIELLITVLLLGVLAFVAIPRMQSSILSRFKSETLAQKIVTDLRLARNFAITDAAHNTSGFAVQMTGASPYRSYNIINLATGEVVSSHTIDNNVSCSGGSLFKFGPMGNLIAGSGTQLLVEAAGKTFTIDIVAATGTVQCVEN